MTYICSSERGTGWQPRCLSYSELGFKSSDHAIESYSQWRESDFSGFEFDILIEAESHEAAMAKYCESLPFGEVLLSVEHGGPVCATFRTKGDDRIVWFGLTSYYSYIDGGNSAQLPALIGLLQYVAEYHTAVASGTNDSAIHRAEVLA